jgi:NADH dehydrogenase (ubiquinone) 1 alpha subcomplex subunit 6
VPFAHSNIHRARARDVARVVARAPAARSTIPAAPSSRVRAVRPRARSRVALRRRDRDGTTRLYASSHCLPIRETDFVPNPIASRVVAALARAAIDARSTSGRRARARGRRRGAVATSEVAIATTTTMRTKAKALRALMTARRRAYATSEALSAARPTETPSASYAEAQKRGRGFYRAVCREVPWVLDNYALREVTTETHVRRVLKDLMRAHAEKIDGASNDDAVRAGLLDRALMRGREEMVALEAHHFQRHHMITQFVNAKCVDAVRGRDGESAFLSEFLSGGRKELN